MAKAIVANVKAHEGDRHLVMVMRRNFGYWLRDRIAALDNSLRVELSFSEGLLETWAVREAFLFFCLAVDPDRPTWRAWLAYRNSSTGDDYKAPTRNPDAYLKLLTKAKDQISETAIEALAAEERTHNRGSGGSVIWDRAARYLALRDHFEDLDVDDAETFLTVYFDAGQWIG